MTENTNQVKPIDARQWAVFCHLAGILGILGALIMWLIKRTDDPFIDRQGKESVNFQLTLTLISWACVILPAISMFIPFLSKFALGFLITPLVFFANIASIIHAVINIQNGVDFKYPFSLRIIK